MPVNCKIPCVQHEHDTTREVAKQDVPVPVVAEGARPLSGVAEGYRAPSEVPEDYRLHSRDERGLKGM